MIAPATVQHSRINAACFLLRVENDTDAGIGHHVIRQPLESDDDERSNASVSFIIATTNALGFVQIAVVISMLSVFSPSAHCTSISAAT